VHKPQYQTDEAPTAELTLLVVDDDKDNLNAVKALLEKWNCAAITCQSYASAIEYAKSNAAVDGMLLDYQLGEGDGLALVHELRHIWQKDDLPGALVTAMRDDTVKHAARQAKLHFLPKPVKPASLKALLKYISSR